MPDGIDFTAFVLLGAMGAVLAVGLIYLIAAHWKGRCGISYGVAALVFYTVFYVAAFEYGLLNAVLQGKAVSADMIDVLVLGHSAITAAGVAIFTLLVFGLFVGLRAPLEGSGNPMRAYTGCAAFCAIVVMVLNPYGAVERLRQVSPGPIRMAALAPTAKLQGKPSWFTDSPFARTQLIFPVPGFVRRVEIKAAGVTHFVSGDIRRLTGLSPEAYARMVLAHRLYFDNGKPGPVTIRNAETGHLIAVRQPDGRFRQQIASRKSTR